MSSRGRGRGRGRGRNLNRGEQREPRAKKKSELTLNLSKEHYFFNSVLSNEQLRSCVDVVTVETSDDADCVARLITTESEEVLAEGISSVFRALFARTKEAELVAPEDVESIAKQICELEEALKSDSASMKLLHHFADIVMASLLSSHIMQWDASQRLILCNVTRYFDNIQHTPGVRLFQRHLIEINQTKPSVEPKAQQAKKAASATSNGDVSTEKKPPKEKKQKAPKAAANADKPQDLSRVKILVGEIVECKAHPDAEHLLIETIDLGEDSGPRQIVSGLANYYKPEEMLKKRVLVIANFKPSKFKGVLSSGMVLCAVSDDKVEVISAAEDAPVGTRVVCEGLDGEADAQIDPKKKNSVWPLLAPDLKTNEQREVVWKDKKFVPCCVAPTLANVTVS